jgi:hypothetical protein
MSSSGVTATMAMIANFFWQMASFCGLYYGIVDQRMT